MLKTDIIVLAYNSIDITKKFLQFLYKNTKDEIFNLVIIDNGSDDGTKEYLLEFEKNRSNFSCEYNLINNGVILGRNQAYELSKKYSSPLVCILDNDQMVCQEWLEQHIDFLNNNCYDIIGVEAWQMNKSFSPIRKIISEKECFNYIGCGGMLIKRNVIEKIGLFDEQFSPAYFEDPDFNIRAYDVGFKIGWNKNAKIIHIPHQTLGKINNQREKFLSSYKKFCVKYCDKILPVFKQEK